MLVTVFSLSLVLFLGTGPDRERPTTPPPSAPSSVTPHEPAEPPASEICVGDPAPDFAYQDFDRRWTRLHALRRQGPVLLVLGASEADLSELDVERDDLLSLGVVPVAVVDRTPGGTRHLVDELGLGYTVIPDARQVIAVQFNCTDAGRVVPGWFVVDETGKVRALLRGTLPREDYPALCALALGLPVPGGTVPASR